ncbi:hypothetical protein C8Q80DRAFT_208199 [Daedaleopsis nitida]|nr:hypothetical protein C8Q80DRAFT_208199 [Daedaleopsis nitida]
MASPAHVGREDAVEEVHAAQSLPHASSAARHAEDADAAQTLSPSSGIVPIPLHDQNKASSKSSFAAGDLDDDPRPPLPRGFWSPELAPLRREYLKIIGRATALIMVLMWICLPVYWGALSNSANLTGNLEAWFIDRDGARVGQGLVQAVLNYSAPGPQLDWKIKASRDVGNDDNVQRMILEDRVWVAVVVQPNATTQLSRARANGDTTYDPSSAIKVFYSQARQEIATGNYLVPLTTQMLQSTTTAYSSQTAQRYFAQINSNGEPNATALRLIANAPQTITPGISWTMVNLRPYNAPAAQAVTLVGNIFLCIFAFMITMANSTARALVAPHMPFLSYIGLRISVPLLAYFPLSMSYALINVAFKLPLGTKFGDSAGFILSFFYIYLGMAALGLSIEAMITILTPRFAPFFLFTLILYNVSPVVLPDELQNPFYSYGNGFPIWNLSQALRTIMFDTNSHLGLNAAVIVAWIIMSCGTLTVFTWLMRRIDLRRRARAIRPKSPTKAKTLSTVEKGKEKSVD